MDRFFRVTDRGSTIGTEVIAGVVTFATMAYILVVNPSILGALPDSAGTTLDHTQLVTVTALVAGVLTIAMGLIANVPMALAAGLGVNAFVAYTLVGGRGLTWPEAMGVIVIEGVVMLVLVLVGLREAIMDAIPDALKRAIAGGIGLFIALIGLVDGGIVEHPKDGGTIVALSSGFSSWNTVVFIVALAVMAVLMAWRVPGALLIGIVAATVVGLVVNAAADGTPVAGAVLPDAPAAAPDFSLVGDINFNVFDVVGVGAALALIVTVLMANFFDAMGTALAIGREARLTDEAGQLPQMRRVLLVESAGAIAGGGASASSNTIFVESTAGAAQGGRTGLANIVTGVLFLLAMFFAPLATMIPSAATGPALVVVGSLMIAQVAAIDWQDVGVGVPAFATLALMPFTYSIANGVGAGMILYVLIALARGRWRTIHPLLALVAAVFVWYFVRGPI
ncbi:NCS2 family permease [Nocardioides sp. Kera G14]|uniref:NCS2 family permease n=1 Tax=Nocardioides sp. Kera G14 TaxID=2884264 RepID=UPI001D10B80A|nr:NCS2 family permease [Nocardioides sp. Kera G14]UDY25057.1 NCS2 family permease [Nocardioides sp. Kera G14]